MTVEEKAKDLMISIVKLTGNATAKWCAILVCDEVINGCGMGYDMLVDADEGLKEAREKMGAYTVVGYWSKVKKQIEDNY